MGDEPASEPFGLKWKVEREKERAVSLFGSNGQTEEIWDQFSH